MANEKARLKAIREFVQWWDGPGKGDKPKGGGSGANQHKSKRDGSDTVAKAGKKGIPDRVEIQRQKPAHASGAPGLVG